MAGAEIARPPVYRITLAQLLVLVVLCLVLLASDTVRAYSVLSGGLIAIVSRAYFAALAFRWRGARSARAIARSSYVGQVGKFLLSIAGFAVVLWRSGPWTLPASLPVTWRCWLYRLLEAGYCCGDKRSLQTEARVFTDGRRNPDDF